MTKYAKKLPHRNEIEGVTDAETRAQTNTKAAKAAPQLWAEITNMRAMSSEEAVVRTESRT